MRKKREQQKQAAAKVEAEKNKNISGNDKILNILSNTENQGLINNLLGIGKTLGLTGKQNVTAPLPPPPPPPPPPPENTDSSNQSTTQEPQQNVMQANMIRPNVALSWPSQQQWGNQHYNPRMAMPGYGPGIPPIPTAPIVGISPNFTQPPPNLLNNITPNFSQPPPNFNINRPPLQNIRAPGPVNTKDQLSFSSESSNTDVRFIPNDRFHNFGAQSNFRRDDQERRDINININPNLNEQNQFRPTDTFGTRNDAFNDRAQHFRKDDRNYNDFGNSQLNPQNNFNLGNDRFDSTNSSFGSGNTRFGEENNRLGPMGNKFPLANDRFGANNDRFGPNPDSGRFGNEWGGPESDRFKSIEIGPFGMDKNRRGTGNDRFESNDERFGSILGIDRFESKDRFFSNNDRFGSNSEHFRPNDRFNRGNTNYFESKDPNDHRRDNFGANSRGFNRNPPFSPPNELPPELKKLMEKRKAAGDVFRPSFVDSDKSSTIGSLRESFKKIAGDSPFRSFFDFQKNLPNRNQMTFPTSGSLNFHPHLGQASTSTYGSRSDSFSADALFKESVDNFIKQHNSRHCNEQQGKDIEIKPDSNQSQPTNIQSQIFAKHSENIETVKSDSSLQTDDIANANNAKMQINEVDNSIKQTDLVPEDNLTKNDNTEGNKISGNDDSLQQNDNNQTESNTEEKDNNNDKKKSESLPFMGENDPRPEDLNIEPPPELPNLCPISTDSNQNVSLNLNDENRKESANNQCDVRFDCNFDSRGMDFKSDTPFVSRGPPIIGDNLAASRMLGPTFQSQGPMDAQLNLQGPNNDQFSLNTTNDFNSNRSNDKQNNMRDCNEKPEDIKSSNQQFNPRDSIDERFRQVGPLRPLGNAKFLNDRQIGLRGSIDPLFAPRTSGPLFGFRSGDMQFRPRGINDCMDFRTILERPFGPRGFNDALCGPKKPNDMPFGIRGIADLQFNPLGSNRFGRPEIFDKRPLFDNNGSFSFSGEKSLGPHKSNEGMPSSHNSTEHNSFGSRDINLSSNTKRFKSNRFEPRDSNDGLCLQDFKTKGSINNLNSPNLSNRTDPFYNRNDFMRRNPFVRREQIEDDISAAKRAKYEKGSSLDEFGKSYSDRNIDTEMREDNTNEYVRRITDPYKKKLDDVEHCSRYGFNDTWKDKLGNDQRLDENQHKTIDKNISNVLDERSSGSDFQSKYNSNLFTKQKIGEEFYVQKQFNYNHGEIDKKFTAECYFTPTKVIDYGHASRSPIIDQISSLCFDYAHGEFKPTLDRDQQQQHHYSKRDFRNWVESEQNLKEYTEKMKIYENMKGCTDKMRSYENYYDACKSDYNMRKEHDWQSKDKKYEGDRKENEDHKERGFNPEERFFERDFNNDQNDRCQSDRNVPKGNLIRIFILNNNLFQFILYYNSRSGIYNIYIF